MIELYLKFEFSGDNVNFGANGGWSSRLNTGGLWVQVTLKPFLWMALGCR